MYQEAGILGFALTYKGFYTIIRTFTAGEYEWKDRFGKGWMKQKNFEEALGTLERIIEKMEREELPLEDSLKAFEEGVRLVRFCREKLNEAEKKIEILMKDDQGNEKIEPFDAGSSA